MTEREETVAIINQLPDDKVHLVNLLLQGFLGNTETNPELHNFERMLPHIGESICISRERVRGKFK